MKKLCSNTTVAPHFKLVSWGPASRWTCPPTPPQSQTFTRFTAVFFLIYLLHTPPVSGFARRRRGTGRYTNLCVQQDIPCAYFLTVEHKGFVNYLRLLVVGVVGTPSSLSLIMAASVWALQLRSYQPRAMRGFLRDRLALPRTFHSQLTNLKISCGWVKN
jgi:hypothetical protein